MSISPRKAIAAICVYAGRIRFLRAEGKGILWAMPYTTRSLAELRCRELMALQLRLAAM